MLVISCSLLALFVALAASLLSFGVAEYVEVVITDSCRELPTILQSRTRRPSMLGSLRLQRLRASILRCYTSRPLALEVLLNVLRVMACAMMILVWYFVGELAGLLLPTRIVLGVLFSLKFFSDYRGALRLHRRVERNLKRDQRRIRQIQELEPGLQQRYHARYIDAMLRQSKSPAADFKRYVAFLLGPDGPPAAVTKSVLQTYANGTTEIAEVAKELLARYFGAETAS